MGRSQMPKYIFAAVLSLAACAATPQSAPEELNEPTLYDFLLGEIALQRRSVTLAAKTYLELAKHTRDPRVARRAVEVANLARLPDLAIEAAKTWLDIEPSSPQALQVTAALLIGSKRVEEAEPYLERLLAADGVNLENGFMQLSRLLAGNPDKSANLRVVRQLAAKHPKLAPAQFAIAQAALVAGDDDAAVAAARSAAALRPEWEPPAVLEAQVLQKRSPAAAAKRLEAFVAKNPGSREGRLNYARALVLDKRFPEARKQFEALLAANPGNTDVIYAVGLLAYQLKDYPVAEENMKRLLGLGYRDANGVRYLLGQIAEEQKAWPRAIEWYEQIVSGEQVVPARLRAASAIAKQGRLDEARAYLKRAAEDNTRLAEARKLIEKALELSPEDYFIIDSLGWVLYREGNLKGAAEQLRRAYSGRPDAEIGAHLGEVLWVMGRRDEAERIWQESVKSAPENDTLQKTIKRFKR